MLLLLPDGYAFEDLVADLLSTVSPPGRGSCLFSTPKHRKDRTHSLQDLCLRGAVILGPERWWGQVGSWEV